MIIKEFYKRLITSWATWTGALVTICESSYALGLAIGWWTFPKESFAQIMATVVVILGALYSVFAIGNNPTNRNGY